MSTPTRDDSRAGKPADIEAGLEKMALACRILEMEGHASRTLGHAALRDPAGRGFWLKRGQIALGEVMGAADFLLVSFDGEVLAGEGRRHSEWPIHAEILKRRPDVEVVVHTHPFYGRVFSAITAPLGAVSNAGNWFPAPPPRFELTSELVRTPEMGRAVAEALGEHFALFLRNHGVVFCGRSIAHAMMMGIQLEDACREHLTVAQSGLPWAPPEDAERARKYEGAGAPHLIEPYFDYFSRKLAREGR